jgi:hypothetical protein
MAAAGALVVGVTPTAVLDGLASFAGVGRRFELKGEIGGIAVLDDYAHHPTAMRATFAAARARYPGRRLWAVYEPLTYHRTAAMLDAFADVLATADRAAVIDIWAVRDPDTTITSAAALADAVTQRGGDRAYAIGSPEAAAAWLADHVEPDDVVLVMGGGRSYIAAEQLVERLTPTRPRRPSRQSSTRSALAIIAAVSTSDVAAVRVALSGAAPPVVPPGSSAPPVPTGRLYSGWPSEVRQAPVARSHCQACRAQVMTPSATLAKRVRSAFMCGQRRWTSYPASSNVPWVGPCSA